MSSIFYRVLEWLRWLFGVVPRSSVGSPRLYLAIHYSFMALLAILCAVFSNQIRTLLNVAQDMKNLPTWLDRIWCGVMFVLIYLIIRVVLYLVQLLGIEDESEFPDIEADWKDILTALERERLYIDDLPLFLVNGFTPQQEHSAFEAASNIEWKVIAPPMSQTSAVVRAFAREDAVFICCTGVGTTNCQQGKISEVQDSGSGSDSGVFSTHRKVVTGTKQAGELGAIVAKAKAGGTQHSGSLAPPPEAPHFSPAGAAPPASAPPRGIGAFFGTMAPGGLKRAMETFSAINSSSAKGYGKKRLAPISEMESMIGSRRMRYLCQLIMLARKPFCPINGMLQAIPFSWASEQDYARKLAPSIKDDLITVHESLQLQFPVVTVVTELDAIGGMKEFLLRVERVQPGLRHSRAGSSFAAGADVDNKHAEWVIDRGIQWFRGWVYTAFAHDIDNRDNQKLFYMLCEISQRRNALVSLLRDSVYRILQPNLRLHGVYFSATGRASTEQGFIRGVLDKLPESQGDVAWAPQLLRSKQRSRMISVCLFVAAIAMAAAAIGLYLYESRGGGVLS